MIRKIIGATVGTPMKPSLFGGGSGGSGGGGGSDNNAKLTIANTTGWLSATISEGSDCKVSFSWSSLESELPTGDGVLNIFVGSATTPKHTRNITQGAHTIDIADYLSAGSNSVKVEVSDVYGNKKSIRFSIKVHSVSISSHFDGSRAYTGAIPFTYTPVGDVEKTVHFLVDGKEIGTATVTTSRREQPYTIPAQTHGSHTLEVYFTCEIDGSDVESNRLYYDLVCYTSGNTTPIIAVPQKTFDAKQYGTVAIPYVVYTPNSETSTVVLKEGTTTVQTLTVDRKNRIWSYKAKEDGEVELSIVCGDTVKTISFTVAESDIDISAETANLELYLSSNGKSNDDLTNRGVWSYGTTTATLSNFNFTSDGWKLDEGNNTVLRVTGDARINIPFNIFGSNCTTNGKTIELEFATRDVLNYDTDIITCWSGGRGIKITAQKALLKSAGSEISTQFKENETVRIAFTVEKSSKNRLLAIYINGIMSGVVQYPDGDDFKQTSPVGISIGSNYCTTDIYCIRVYNTDLSSDALLTNWIADTQDVELMAARYNRNNIFDDYGKITIENLPSNLPYMVLDVDEYSKLPQSKGDKKTVSGRYVDPLNEARSFTFENAEIDVQGTSSATYSRKNYKVKFKGGFDNNGKNSSTYTLRGTSMPTDVFTFKADVASSEGANNVELVRLYDDACPVKTPPQEADSRVRQGIEGYPMLMFYGTGANPTFLGKYNFNNDKSTEEVFGFAEGDESWEILLNNTDMVIWKDDNFEGDTWKQSFEARFPEDNTNTTNLAAFATWLKSTDTTVEGLTEEEKTERLAKFKDEFEDYCNVDAMLFNYIFTEMFLMVDNRAKNAFPTRYDADGKWLILPYDFDTAIGINNEGELKFGYHLEDTDTVDGNNVFNGQDSVLYVNMRLAFADEIKEMYGTLRAGDVFSYEEIEKRFEEHQGVWGEAVFNEDAKFKYLEPLTNDGDSSYLPMLQGSKASQRKWWLYNRFRYLDSKYVAGDAKSDFVQIRPHAKADLVVTPYADIYATAEYDGTFVKKRATRGVACTLENPLTGGNDPVVNIYSASQLASLGDLSGHKLLRADFSRAVKLSSLKVGSGASGYDNPNLTNLTVGNLTLLREIDVRNCSNLTQAVDLSGCTNIEEVYFDGTKTTGVTLPNGGILKKLQLPNTVTNLTVRNQSKLTTFVMPISSQVSTLWVENTPIIPVREIFSAMSAGSRVRLIGVDWTFDSVKDIYALYDKLNTCRGLTESGGDTNDAVVQGTFRVSAITEAQIADLNAKLPNVTIVGSTENAHKITFMADGKVYAQDAKVSGGTITAPSGIPTKATDAYATYTFAGWSRNGTNVLGNLGTMGDEDVTYYAVFTENVIMYTVRFFDADGETVLDLERVSYGTTVTPPSTEKEDHDFLGWKVNGETVTDFTITGDTDFYGEWKYHGDPSIAYTYDEDDNVIKATAANYKVAPSFADHKDTIKIIDLSQCQKLTSIPSRYCREHRVLEQIVLPDSVTSIGDTAFGYCTSLIDFTFPSGVEQLGSEVFLGCSFTSMTIPDSVKRVGSWAFQNCELLTSVTFGRGVESIGGNVFYACNSVKDVTVLATTPPEIATTTIKNTITKIYVPAGCGDAYKSATNWSAYADRIEELAE